MDSIWSKRGRIVLGAIGLALALAPIIGAQVLIPAHTRNQAQGDVDQIASDFVAHAEAAIDSGLIALTNLAVSGIGGCGESDLDTMRRTVYSNFWIKEVAVLDGDGQIVCNHIGDRVAVRALSPRYPSRNRSISIALVELGSGGRPGVMLIWSLDGGNGLSAIVPVEAFTDGPLPKDLRSVAAGEVGFVNGATIGGFPQAGTIDPRQTDADHLIRAAATSARYPITVRLSAPYDTFLAAAGELLAYARVGGGVVSTLIFALLVYALRGPPVELARLKEAAGRGEFVPYYQPIVDVESDRLVGCEVLMRWLKPGGTVVSPDAFIHQAEASGLAGPMTLSLMRQVRHDLDEVFGARPHLKVSVNLFNWHFASLRIVRDVEEIFGRGRMGLRQLVFELTERQPLDNVEMARVVIRQLQGLGARVALDDAGTGHSGLAHLHQLNVDVVKIDKLFVDTIDAGQGASPIVDSLIKLAHDLGMEVIAEGVETFDQLDYLRAHGADAAQGYLFAPPLPARAFLDMVALMEPLTGGRSGAAATEAGWLADEVA